tara:strand:+ start:1569 stop:2042 length:474 start_codon:yes stop_codon:yes gene_type:complete
MEEKKCSICYEKLILENSMVTPCKHFFCSKCFFRWIKTKNTCPMCRQDLINQERIFLPSYSAELIELIAKGEDISVANMGIINENRNLLREKSIIMDEIKEGKETEKNLLLILARGNKEIKKQRQKLVDTKRKIRIEKIKQINLKKQKLRKYGKIYL